MDYQLAVIGAGVSGMVAALLAKQANISVVLVDKLARGQQQSHAHYLNAYSIEILAQVGLDLEALANVSVASPQAVTMAYGYSFSQLYHVVDLDKDPDYVKLSSQQGPYGACLNVRYDYLVQALLALIDAEDIPVLWQHSFESLSLASHTVSLRVAQEDVVLKVSTLLACDGTHSKVRSCVVDDFRPPAPLQNFVSFVMHADLRPYVAQDALLYWIYHRACRCCVVAHDLANYQVVQLPIFPPYDNVADYSVTRLQTLMQKVVGDDHFKPDITELGSWQMSSFVLPAMQYDWVYLAGDAAHTMTPAGGLGLNTALADVFNMIWKLAAYQRRNHADIMASYQLERHPVAVANVQNAYDNYQDFVRPAAALGLDIAHAPSFAALQQGIRHYCPSPLANTLNEIATLPMQWAYDVVHANNPLAYELKKNMLHKIYQNAHHFSGVSQHLMFRYEDGFYVDTGGVQQDTEFRVGARLPYLCCNKNGKLVSTYDVFSYRKWMLLVGVQVKADFVIELDRCVVVADDALADIQQSLANRWVLVRPDAIVAWYGKDRQALAALIKKWIF